MEKVVPGEDSAWSSLQYMGRTMHRQDGAQRGHTLCGLEGCRGGAAASLSRKEPRRGVKEALGNFFCCCYGPGARVLTNSGKAWGCLSKIDADVL